MKDEPELQPGDPTSENVALLMLLRTAPRGVLWSDISAQVRFDGSAVRVLMQVQQATVGLFPDPTADAALVTARDDLAAWQSAGFHLITVLSPEYPVQLAGVFDCPPFIFTEGTVIPADRGISVVGSRKCSPKGERMARDAARLLADRGLTVIAGLAEGIDTAAHQEALALGARTVAVIGTGITKHYPSSNRALQDEIARKGLVISQFYPDQPPTKTTFPMRNATMSGYGLATIIVEAGENSGSRIQAREAADHGRPVILSSEVATTTSWGAAMANADSPWVYVASSGNELADAVDEVTQNVSESMLQSLGLVRQ